jgi:hypothetical protein
VQPTWASGRRRNRPRLASDEPDDAPIELGAQTLGDDEDDDLDATAGDAGEALGERSAPPPRMIGDE